MDDDNFRSRVIALVVPMALQNLINVGVNATDVIMLGRVGEKALSGCSLAGQVLFVLNLFLFGMTSGACVLTAQYWGKGDRDAIEKILGIVIRLAETAGIAFMLVTLLIPVLTAQYWGKGDRDAIEKILGIVIRLAETAGIAFMLVTLLIPGSIMKIFTNDPEVIAEGCKYLRIVALTYPVTVYTMGYLNVMKSVEKVSECDEVRGKGRHLHNRVRKLPCAELCDKCGFDIRSFGGSEAGHRGRGDRYVLRPHAGAGHRAYLCEALQSRCKGAAQICAAYGSGAV